MGMPVVREADLVVVEFAVNDKPWPNQCGESAHEAELKATASCLEKIVSGQHEASQRVVLLSWFIPWHLQREQVSQRMSQRISTARSAQV
jgi:hypothetical protein